MRGALVIVRHTKLWARGTRVAGLGGREYQVGPDGRLHLINGHDVAQAAGCLPEDADEYAQFAVFSVESTTARVEAPPPPPPAPLEPPPPPAPPEPTLVRIQPSPVAPLKADEPPPKLSEAEAKVDEKPPEAPKAPELESPKKSAGGKKK